MPPLALVALVALATGLGVHVAFAPAAAGRPALFLALGVPYAAFAAVALARLRRAERAGRPPAAAPGGPGPASPDGERPSAPPPRASATADSVPPDAAAPDSAAPDSAPPAVESARAESGAAPRDEAWGPLRLGLRSGDVSFGFAVALALGLASAFGRRLLAPTGSPAELWLVRIYLQFGEVPRARPAYAATAAAVVAVALLEELTWRGLVQSLLAERFGPRRAWAYAAALFGAAHAPTAWQLTAPGLGPNPLVIAAALGCGAVWGLLAGRLGRLGPSLASHALYTYGLTMAFPLWP
jgi:membrane protease YdiL (CAAX protease family)